MRVIATITIDGNRETRIEDDSPFMAGEPGDELERKGLGVWFSDWRYCSSKAKGANHKGRVFLPWSSVLYCEETGQR